MVVAAVVVVVVVVIAVEVVVEDSESEPLASVAPAVVEAAVVVGAGVVVGAAVVVVFTAACDSWDTRACAANDRARSRSRSRCSRWASVQAAARSEKERRSTDSSGVKRLSTGGSTAAPAVVDKYRPSKINPTANAAMSLRRPCSMASRTASLSSGCAVFAVAPSKGVDCSSLSLNPSWRWIQANNGLRLEGLPICERSNNHNHKGPNSQNRPVRAGRTWTLGPRSTPPQNRLCACDGSAPWGVGASSSVVETVEHR